MSLVCEPNLRQISKKRNLAILDVPLMKKYRREKPAMLLINASESFQRKNGLTITDQQRKNSWQNYAKSISTQTAGLMSLFTILKMKAY